MHDTALVRLLDDLFGQPFFGVEQSGTYYTDVDVHEDAERVTILLDAPGVKREDIDISLNDRRLIITGERKPRFTPKDGERLKVRRSFGPFQRIFTLSSVLDESKLSADLTDGVLTVTIPKGEKSKPRKIAIGA